LQKILACLLKWPTLVLIGICGDLDVALSLLLKACFKLCPEILTQIVLEYAAGLTFLSWLPLTDACSVDLLAQVALLTLLGFVNTLACLGL